MRRVCQVRVFNVKYKRCILSLYFHLLSLTIIIFNMISFYLFSHEIFLFRIYCVTTPFQYRILTFFILVIYRKTLPPPHLLVLTINWIKNSITGWIEKWILFSFVSYFYKYYSQSRRCRVQFCTQVAAFMLNCDTTNTNRFRNNNGIYQLIFID